MCCLRLTKLNHLVRDLKGHLDLAAKLIVHMNITQQNQDLYLLFIELMDKKMTKRVQK